MTPVKQLTVGDTVLVIGYESYGLRTIASLYIQTDVPGGVRLDARVDGLYSWNEDQLRKVAP